MSNCKDCKDCNKEVTLHDDLLKARMKMIAERVVAKNDFEILTSVIREQYIELRIAPYRMEYERLLALAEQEENQEKSKEGVQKFPLYDYN